MKFPSPLLILLAASTSAAVECGNVDEALEYWRPIREQAEDNALPADKLAIEFLPCLGSENAELRDRIGYELLTYWLRNDKLTDETRLSLATSLQSNLASEDSLLRSFSALVLAEVMRSDANKPFLLEPTRGGLLQSAITALTRESDYRGLEPDIGWVHPVAHLADLLWRFALHPETNASQAEQILFAVKAQVAPTSVSYAFNEGDRLARIVSTIIRRGLVPTESVALWISAFGRPDSMPRWGEAFQSPEGMAALHNTKQFLRALSDQLAGDDIDESIRAPLDELVGGVTQLI